MRLAHASSTFALLITASLLAPACFGDNADGAPSPVDQDSLAVLAIMGPDEADEGISIDLTVQVKGAPEEELSIELNGSLGTFSPQNQAVTTDGGGNGSMVTRYTPGNAGGAETITAKVSAAAATGTPLTKAISVYAAERIGNTAAVGAAAAQNASVLIAYPFVLATPRVVRKLGIFAPTQSPAALVDAQVGLYSTDTTTSLDVLAKTTAKIAPGANELEIPPQMLAAGTYWFVVAYDGAPLIYRAIANPIILRYKTNHNFAGGLADKITGLSTSDTTVNVFYPRSLYLVLRK